MRNNIIKYSSFIWVLIAFAFIPRTGFAQEKKDKKDKKAAISQAVSSRSYIFKAQTAMPQAGSTRQLTTDFDLRVSKDTIVSDLPYFGRAYTAPMNPSEGPLRFTTTQFDYSVTDRKKGGWNVVITPKDMQDPRQITLTIFDNGSASAVVTSYNRQPISFNGYVIAKR